MYVQNYMTPINNMDELKVSPNRDMSLQQSYILIQNLSLIVTNMFQIPVFGGS